MRFLCVRRTYCYYDGSYFSNTRRYHRLYNRLYAIRAVIIIAIYFSDVDTDFCFVEVEHILLNKSFKRLILLWHYVHASRTNLLFLLC